MENKKIKVTFKDGAVYTGDSCEEIIKKLKLTMWKRPPTRKEYMEGMSKRAKKIYSYDLNYSNEEEFLRELERVGEIKITGLDN